MTDLPDEIVERVARAILETDPTCNYDKCKERIEKAISAGDTLEENWWLALHKQARAALQASGWGEMRFALLKCANAIKRIGDNTGEFGSVTDDRFWDDLWVAEDNARAALAAARGEKP